MPGCKKKLTLNIFLTVLILLLSCSKLSTKKKYTDSDNDTIIELDTERRNIIQSVTLKANHVYDDEKELEKAKTKIQSQVLSARESEYGLYRVLKGESLKSISVKLYGTKDRWKEIFLLNEERLIKNEVIQGLIIRYKKNLDKTQSNKPMNAKPSPSPISPQK